MHMKDIMKEANDIIEELEEHLDTYDMVQERTKNDDGTRYTLDEIRKIIDNKGRREDYDKNNK